MLLTYFRIFKIGEPLNSIAQDVNKYVLYDVGFEDTNNGNQTPWLLLAAGDWQLVTGDWRLGYFSYLFANFQPCQPTAANGSSKQPCLFPLFPYQLLC